MTIKIVMAGLLFLLLSANAFAERPCPSPDDIVYANEQWQVQNQEPGDGWLFIKQAKNVRNAKLLFTRASWVQNITRQADSKLDAKPTGQMFCSYQLADGSDYISIERESGYPDGKSWRAITSPSRVVFLCSATIASRCF